MKATELFNIFIQSGFFCMVLSLVVSGIKYAKTYIDAKTAETTAKIKNADVRNAINSAEDCISTVVLEMSQTVADDLKAKSADGKLTADEAGKIQKDAVEKVESLLSVEVRSTLNSVYDDVNAWITSKIEAAVKNSKQSAAS